MSQPQNIEAARAKIQRLVEEIAALSKSDMRSEDYYKQFLGKAVEACDAKGGAIWLVGQRTADGKSEFQLAAVVDLESSLFQTDETQRSLLLNVLGEVVRGKEPVVIAAESKGVPGSLQSQLQEMGSGGATGVNNRTPYPFINVPLFLKEQVLGVLQVWLQPYVTKENYAEFATFLGQLATNVEQHFQSRRLGNLVVENQRLQHLLKFSTDITGSLDPLEVARLVANYSRDLLSCERCSLFQLKGGKWHALAISGQETVESKSTMVKAMVAFIDQHLPRVPKTVVTDGTENITPQIVVLDRKQLLADPAPEGSPEEGLARALTIPKKSDVDVAYFEVSHATSGLLCQALDGDKNVVGALFAESTVEGFFAVVPGGAEVPATHRLMDWLATNAGRGLKGALDYQELPMLAVSRRLRDTRRAITGDDRRRNRFKLVFFISLIAAILLFPWMEEVESDCTLVPQTKSKVVPEIAGTVAKVFVREGQAVKKGDPLAQLDIKALETELKATREDKLRYDAEARRFRGDNDEGGAQIAVTQRTIAEEKEAKILRDIEAATIRSPLEGVVLTSNIEMFEGVYLQPGADFATIAANNRWDIHVHINEKEIGKVEKELAERVADKESVPVHYILYTHNAHQLRGELKSREQFSQIAYPHERENALRENAFILTLRDIEAPEEVRRGFRPDLTGRASIELGRKPLIYLWCRNFWNWIQLKWVW